MFKMSNSANASLYFDAVFHRVTFPMSACAIDRTKTSPVVHTPADQTCWLDQVRSYYNGDSGCAWTGD